MLSHDHFKRLFSEVELSALRQLVDEAGGREIPVGDPNVSSEELIRQNEGWAAVRDAAKRCLLAMKFDLERWEATELKDA